MDQILDFFGGNHKKDPNYKKDTKSVNNINRRKSDCPKPTKFDNHVNNIDININNDINDKITKDLDTLRQCDYDRSKFNYTFLSNIGWWPDEILKYAEINRLSYVEFRQVFDNKSDMFDRSIRNAIYFMNQDPYCEDKIIKEFISGRTTDISDNYWNRVVEEDNCFMDGLEDRNRSKDENQHHKLLQSLIKLLTYKTIEADGLLLKSEYIDKIKIFIAIYNLKYQYNMIDDALRNILYASIIKEEIVLYLPLIFYMSYIELKDTILIYANSTHDQDLMNRAYLYKDLLSYALYKTTQFGYVYNKYDDFVTFNNLPDFHENYITPFGHSKFINMFTNDDIKRIEYVYLNYHNKLMNKQQKDKLIIQNIDFTKLLEKNEDIASRPRILTPKYSTKNRNYMLENQDYPIFYVKDTAKKSNINNKNTLIKNQMHKRSKSSTFIKK